MAPSDLAPEAKNRGQAPAGRLPRRIWGLAFTAALLAGLTTWLIGEAFNDRYNPPLRDAPGLMTEAEARALAIGRTMALRSKVTIAFGSLGAALGLALGLAGGVATCSSRSAWTAGLVGSILGGACAAVSSLILLRVYLSLLNPDSNDLSMGMAFHAGAWSVIGATGGIAFGIGLGDRHRIARAALGGLLGAVAGAMIYEFVGALAFPLDDTSKPVSATWGTRLLARLAVTIFASAGAVMATLSPVEKASVPRFPADSSQTFSADDSASTS